jgi:hypothetical protein
VIFANIATLVVAGDATDKSVLKVQVWPTFGTGGPVRPPTIDVGDTFTATVLVDGVKANENAQLDISGEWRLIDEEGRTLLGPWSDRNVPHLGFGGASSALYVGGEIPRDFAPGKYTVRVLVTDHIANRRATSDLALTVLESQFGATGLRLSYDQSGDIVSAGSFVVGQTMYVHYSLGNFATVDESVQVKNTLAVIDEAREPVGAPIELVAKGPVRMFSRSNVIPGMFHLNVNAPGRFLLRITLEDEFAMRKRVIDIPVVCHPADVSAPNESKLR